MASSVKTVFDKAFFCGLAAQNRARFLQCIGLKSGIVYLAGGESSVRYDTDVDIDFRQESNFYYLSCVTDPDCALAIDLSSSKVTLFAPKLPDAHALWLGAIKPLDQIREENSVDEVKYASEAADHLKAFQQVYALPKQTVPGVEEAQVDRSVLRSALIEARMIKSADELALMRHAAQISSRGHELLMRAVLRDDVTAENHLHSEFLYHCYKNNCRFQAYTAIVAAGRGGAVLHYMDNNAPIKGSDMMLVDAGAEFGCYAADITRCFPANGEWTDAHKEIYNIVLHCQKEVIAKLKPGVSYLELHELALRLIGEGLVKYGFLKGSVDELMEHDIPAVFCPHGLGHLIGLDVHDVGGYPDGVERSTRPSFRYLRMNRVLKENMVITIEPGCYFVSSALEPALADPAQSKYFVLEKIAQFRDFGGVRIEDDIVITKDGSESLSDAVKEIADIQAIQKKQ
mmetsp:Transcript_45070/g.113517  ORF Transcript_45070/g.113517 Transcript_45070/m.113517 type:complete len:457 (+) Transcript_45070:115-1485(+)|eukprot:CAMPEP_0177668508 /NCGR_PEP_ID=MMETSP0447-20121125/22817_1 /TAXON_ID=0 /ORGANISM="Stygamoeba regulata, Strain BSH-02190019" /LENGTH=456 /DNA_ID=CAMNT_0019175057 /DNA_START=98 /DNA_END=1468 /DNA_ORIENTATION=+